MSAERQPSLSRAASKQLIWCIHASISTEKHFPHYRGQRHTAQLGKFPNADPARGADVDNAVIAERLPFVVTEGVLYAAAVTMPVKS